VWGASHKEKKTAGDTINASRKGGVTGEDETIKSVLGRDKGKNIKSSFPKGVSEEKKPDVENITA